MITKDKSLVNHRVERAAERLTDPLYKKRELLRAVVVCKWIWLAAILVLYVGGLPFACALAVSIAFGFSLGQWVGTHMN